MASKKIVTASTVRAWAKENLSTIEGLPEGYTLGERGRIHPAIRAAFDKANKGVRYEVGHKEPKTVQVRTFVTNKKGGKTPLNKKVDVQALRVAAKEAGVTVGKRGIPNREVLAAFARGDLASLAS